MKKYLCTANTVGAQSEDGTQFVTFSLTPEAFAVLRKMRVSAQELFEKHPSGIGKVYLAAPAGLEFDFWTGDEAFEDTPTPLKTHLLWAGDIPNRAYVATDMDQVMLHESGKVYLFGWHKYFPGASEAQLPWPPPISYKPKHYEFIRRAHLAAAEYLRKSTGQEVEINFQPGASGYTLEELKEKYGRTLAAWSLEETSVWLFSKNGLEWSMVIGNH